MTKTEQRIRAFSSGMKKLDNHSRNYIHRLTQILFLAEHPPVYPVSGKKAFESKKKNRSYGVI
jgi:hypothetical protein